MTVWNKPVSWSKFKLALDCPRQLQYTIDKHPVSDTRPNFYAEAGTITQFVFEQIFNQGINMRPGGETLSVFERATEKILKSSWYLNRQITYPYGKTEEDLFTDVRNGVRKGWEIFKDLKLLNRPIRSEVKWMSTFRNMRVFALIDFVLESQRGIAIYDGKGHAKKDADERQLLYYALTVQSSNKPVSGGGFLYWKHGFEKVDISPEAVKEFVDGPFIEGQAIMRQLMGGIATDLPTKPGKSCHFCSWKNVCPDSTELKPPVDHSLPELVGFKTTDDV